MTYKTNLLISGLICSLMCGSAAIAAAGDNRDDDGVQQIFAKRSISARSQEIAGLNGYAIQPFGEDEKNRNHYDSRNNTPVKFLAMHYTVCNLNDTLGIFTKDISDGRASAHYVMTENEAETGVKGGIPIQVVPEEMRSWHAGISAWGDVKNLNASSIGIENVNTTYEDSEKKIVWVPFDKDQITALGKLSQDIVKRHKILPQNVVGHADIAPERKSDPGPLFPWGSLYNDFQVGAGLSQEEQDPSYVARTYQPKEPCSEGISEPFFLTGLQAYGYVFENKGYITPEAEPVIRAFKAHYSRNMQPEHYNATVGSKEMVYIYGLNAKYPRQ